MKAEFSPILVHIPHASTFVPPELRETFLPPDLSGELLRMTDLYCDQLFACGQERFLAPVSRLVCDMERFREDGDEIMSACGMGAVYTRCADGSPLRSVNAAQREQLLRQYYDPHHAALTGAVARRLERFGTCLIMDGHSFYPEPLPYELDQTAQRPDFCIGTDAFHTGGALAARAMDFFRESGAHVALNSPFSGTMVPLPYYQKEPAVQSIMIEVNRRLYVDEWGQKQQEFGSVRRLLAKFVHEMLP